MDLQVIVLPLFILWGLGLIIILFRRGLDWIWKLSCLLIYVFYFAWFYKEAMSSWRLFQTNFGDTFQAFLNNSMEVLALGLFLFWPILSIIFGISANSGSVRNNIRILVLMTLFYWIFWFLIYFIYPHFGQELRGYIPDTFRIPDIPKPPV